MYPTKGGEPIHLTQPLIIVCSNKSIRDLYKNTHSYLEARFQEINVDPA